MFIALVIGFGVPFVISDRIQGLFFNVSYAGTLGDIGLFIVALIGTTVIQRGGPLPTWFAGTTQLAWLIICALIGYFLATKITPWPINTWPNRYHNGVIVPVFLFFVPMMLLATLCNGNRVEIATSFLLIAIWAALVVYDFKDDRIRQSERLERMFGLTLVDGRFVRK